MILLLSQAQSESSTEDVMDWLEAYGATYHRFNGEDMLTDVHYRNGELVCPNVDFNAVSVCWYRRSISQPFFDRLITGMVGSQKNETELKNYLKREYKVLKRRLVMQLEDRHWLSHPNEANVNKLYVLEQARSVGLTTPDTLVTTQRSTLMDFIEEVGTVISKPIGEVSTFMDDTTYQMLKTCLLTEETLAEVGERFYPTLFQACVEKAFELRVFYLDEAFYPMAIFSQNDEQTKVDFRNYNMDRPNRTTPYQLPCALEAQLLELVKKLGLTSGSFDLIKATDGRYIFLEVNPIGQFGMTSKPCNYFLEEKIAQHLIYHDKTN